MSIIADTLQRLQARNNGDGSDVPDSQSVVIPPIGKREPGWHAPPSSLKFWLAGIAMAIGLSGLGLFAYWIGFNLDFGVATYASPKNSESMAFSASSPLPDPPLFDSPSSEFIQVPVPNPVQDLPSSGSQQLVEELLSKQGAVLPDTPSSPNTEDPLPPTLLGAVSVSSETEARSIQPTPRQPHQATASTNVSTPNSGTDILPEKERAETKAASTSRLPVVSLTQSDKSESKFDESEEFKAEEKHIPLEIVLEEEPMGMEEFSSTPHRFIDDTPFLPNTTVMIPKKEKLPQTAQAPVPVPRSLTNWLRHAQQLIQARKYKEAVSFLSPLFKDPPVTWEPWFWMGTALLGQGQLEQADQFFLSGLARNDKIPQLWIQRALVAHQHGEYQLAIHELRRAESLDAAIPHTHLNMGYAYEKLGNDRLAGEYYAKFMKLSEGNPAFFSIRKKLYARFTEQVHSTLKFKSGLTSSLPENP
jgi:TolA-binding protein